MSSEIIETTLHDVEVEIDYHDLDQDRLVEFVIEEYESEVIQALAAKGHPLELEQAKDMVLRMRSNLGMLSDHVFEIRGTLSRLADKLGMDEIGRDE
jgi:hypothetical protein